jgi:predicted dehydrogenase
MSEKIGWGIVGTGKIARLLAQALPDTTTGEFIAVGSRSPERARAFAAELPVRRHHEGYDGVIEDPDVDLVYVATHHPDHRAWAVAAAEAGKHVLCEKPLAVHRTDAAAIVDAARRNDVVLLEAFAYRCHPQTQRLVEILRSGAIGEIRMIDAVFGYDAGPTPRNYILDHGLAGGSILDVGCYTTSMAHLIARVATVGQMAEPIDVAGVAEIGASTGVDHYAAAILRFDGGLVARLACSVQVDLESSLRIYGSEGRITVPSPWLPGRIGTRAEIVLQRPGAEPEVVEIELEAGLYAIEADAVGAMVRAGERSPSVMPWEESLANMGTLDRWRASIGLRYEQDQVVVAGSGAGPLTSDR